MTINILLNQMDIDSGLGLESNASFKYYNTFSYGIAKRLFY